MYSFIQETFIKCSICAKHCLKHWSKLKTLLLAAYIPVEENRELLSSQANAHLIY